MQVKDLIAELNKCNPNQEVKVSILKDNSEVYVYETYSVKNIKIHEIVKDCKNIIFEIK